MQILMHFDYMNFIIQIFIIFPVYIISYYDVLIPIIGFFCHYDCSLLKILPSFPELLCNSKFCSNNTKNKIRATGAQTPHSINKSTTLPSTVFLSVCNICTKETSISCSKISSLEKTVDFTLKKCKYYYLEIKFTSECIASPHQKS